MVDRDTVLILPVLFFFVIATTFLAIPEMPFWKMSVIALEIFIFISVMLDLSDIFYIGENLKKFIVVVLVLSVVSVAGYFLTPGLSVSNIAICSSEPEDLGQYTKMENAVEAGDTIYVYAEVSNFDKTHGRALLDFYRTVEGPGRNIYVDNLYEDVTSTPENTTISTWFEIDTDDFEPGIYRAEIKALDWVSNERASKAIEFEIED
jgi:hypothetical protein